MLVIACGHFNRVSISVVGSERLIPDEGISPSQMGLVYSAFLLSYTLAMLPAGWLIDRFGARKALMVWGFGSVIFVGLTAGTKLISSGAQSLWFGLLVVRSLLGVVNTPLHPAAAQTVFERVPAQSRVFANGLVTFAACVGMASTYSVMGFLIDRLNWSWALVVTSLATLIVSIIWTRGTRPTAARVDTISARPTATMEFSQLLAVLSQRNVICLTLSYSALGYFQYLFFYWIEYYFETVQSQDRSVARGYATLVTAAMGIGMVCGGWLADRVPRSFSPRVRRALVPVLGMVSSGVVFESGLLAANPQITLAAFAVAAGLIGACEGVFWTTAVELGGRFGATTASLMNTGCNAGGTLSPCLTPLLSTYFATHYGADLGWRLSLAIAGAVVIAGAGLWWGIGPSTDEAVEGLPAIPQEA